MCRRIKKLWLYFKKELQKTAQKFGKKILILACITGCIVPLLVWLIYTPQGNTALLVLAIISYALHKLVQAYEKATKTAKSDIFENRSQMLADFVWFFLRTYERNLPIQIRPYLSQAEIIAVAKVAELEENVISVKFELPRAKIYDDFNDRAAAMFKSLIDRCALEYCEQNNMPQKAGSSGFNFIDCDNLIVDACSINITLILLDNAQAIERKNRLIWAKKASKTLREIPTVDEDISSCEEDIFL